MSKISKRINFRILIYPIILFMFILIIVITYYSDSKKYKHLYDSNTSFDHQDKEEIEDKKGFIKGDEYCEYVGENVMCQTIALRTVFISTNEKYYPQFLRTEFYSTATMNYSYFKSYLHDEQNYRLLENEKIDIDFETEYIFIAQEGEGIYVDNVFIQKWDNENWIVGLSTINKGTNYINNQIYSSKHDVKASKLWGNESKGVIKKLTLINSNYILFDISECESCAPAVVPNSTFILNITNNEVLDLGKVEVVSINFDTGKVFYQELEERNDLSCNDPYVNIMSCTDDEDTGFGYKPNGTTLEVDLP